MHPILLKLGSITIYSYGAFVALGFAAAVLLIRRRAASFGIDKDNIIDLMILMLVAGVAGARVLYVFLNLEYYGANPYEIINISNGGLVWYGGFFAGIGAAVLYIKNKKMGFWNTMDLIVPYVALAQAFGRVGCFFNGCCYGSNGIPVQLYASLLLVGIFVILRYWQDRRRFKGDVALGYCLLYALKRFGIEFFRGDNPKIFMGFTISQLISLAVVLIAVLILIKKASDGKRKI